MMEMLESYDNETEVGDYLNAQAKQKN